MKAVPFFPMQGEAAAAGEAASKGRTDKTGGSPFAKLLQESGAGASNRADGGRAKVGTSGKVANDAADAFVSGPSQVTGPIQAAPGAAERHPVESELAQVISETSRRSGKSEPEPTGGPARKPAAKSDGKAGKNEAAAKPSASAPVMDDHRSGEAPAAKLAVEATSRAAGEGAPPVQGPKRDAGGAGGKASREGEGTALRPTRSPAAGDSRPGETPKAEAANKAEARPKTERGKAPPEGDEGRVDAPTRKTATHPRAESPEGQTRGEVVAPLSRVEGARREPAAPSTDASVAKDSARPAKAAIPAQAAAAPAAAASQRHPAKAEKAAPEPAPNAGAVQRPVTGGEGGPARAHEPNRAKPSADKPARAAEAAPPVRTERPSSEATPAKREGAHRPESATAKPEAGTAAKAAKPASSEREAKPVAAGPSHADVKAPAVRVPHEFSSGKEEISSLPKGLTATSDGKDTAAHASAPAKAAAEDTAKTSSSKSRPVTEKAPPVTEKAPPVTEKASPVAEKASPVAEKASPVAEKVAPVAEKAPPVTEKAPPVAEKAPPVTEKASPVTEKASPVTEKVSPVTEKAPLKTDLRAPGPAAKSTSIAAALEAAAAAGGERAPVARGVETPSSTPTAPSSDESSTTPFASPAHRDLAAAAEKARAKAAGQYRREMAERASEGAGAQAGETGVGTELPSQASDRGATARAQTALSNVGATVQGAGAAGPGRWFDDEVVMQEETSREDAGDNKVESGESTAAPRAAEGAGQPAGRRIAQVAELGELPVRPLEPFVAPTGPATPAPRASDLVTIERAPLKPAQQAPAPLPLLTAALAAGWQANATATPSGNGDSGESGTRRQEDGRPIAAVGNAAQAFDLGSTVASQLAPPTAAASVDGPPPAPPLPPAAAPLAAEMPEDPGLSLAVLQKAAHLSIESDNGRSLELHVRLLPEGADIRAAGELAPMMQAKANELGLALAAQGVTLGRFELGEGGGGRDPRGDKEAREDESDRPVVRRRSSGGGATTAPTRIADGRISVKA